MDDNKIIQKLVEHDETLKEIKDSMFTKKDGMTMMNILDGIAKTVKKIDEDHAFGVEWIKRLQEEVDTQKKTISEHEKLLDRIKLELKIA